MTPGELLGGIALLVLAFIGFSWAFPYLLAAFFVLALAFGIIFMKVGGMAISTVSVLDRNEVVDAPVWFEFVKLGTLPFRLLDSLSTIYEFLTDILERR